jgi:DNA polymerase (family X)
MNNRDVANAMNRIAALLDIKGEMVYKILAYRRAAENIMNLSRDINEIHREGKLGEIPGVGKALSEKIAELLTTGRLRYLDNLEEEIPAGVVDLLAIPDVGPKTAKMLWEQLGIASVAEAEEAARAGKLRKLKGLGEKSEAKILDGIQVLHRRTDRELLGNVWPVVQQLLDGLRAHPAVERADAAGSFRRRQSTIGDIDLLVAAVDAEAALGAFVGLPLVQVVDLRGPTKCTVHLHNGLQVDLRVLAPERYGSLLQYFTGSKQHNVDLRELSLGRGLSLSEYGFKRADGQDILCRQEEEVYATLGLPWIPPEIREARGEIKAAQQGRLPVLVEQELIRGDLHVHTDWSDGAATLEVMVQAARERGYQYVVISDHSEGLGFGKGLSAAGLREQRTAIDRLNETNSDIHVLQGVEVEIKVDGSLDLPADVLAELDVVVASLHVGLREERVQVTGRLLGAMRNPHVDVIGHPLGRLINQREGADLDIDQVLAVAAETGTVLEVNSSANRLDLDDVHIRRAIELGVRLAINTDAHSPVGFDTLRLGVATARRGWAEAKDVVNTLALEELLQAIKSPRVRAAV